MQSKKRHPFIFLINILIFLLIIVLSSIDSIDISIKNATPFLPLPLIAAFACFHSVEKSAVVGLITGICLDSIALNSYCFNAVAFLALGTFVALSGNTLFNKNIRASVAVSIIVCFVYFVFYWLCFMAFGTGIKNSLIYLLQYAVPSAAYSALFIFPFYYLYRFLNKYKG